MNSDLVAFIRQFEAWQLAAAALAGVVASRVLYTLFFSSLRRFPGPFLAKFTNILRAYRTWQGRIDLVHYDWHRKYGPAVRIGPNTIMLNDPAMIRVVFTTKGTWKKSEMYKPNEALFMGKRVSNMFNTTDEEYHTKYSKPVKPLYSMTRVQEIEPLMDESIVKLFTKLGAKFADTPGAVCDWADWAVWFGWDAMFHITFGEHFGFLDAEADIVNYVRAATEGQYYFSAVSQIPWLDYLLDKNPVVRIGPKPVSTGVATTFQKLVAYQQQGLASSAKEKQQDPEAGAPRVQNYADRFLALKTSHPDVDDTMVFQYTLFNLLAGGDSTASILCAAVYHLAKNPSARATLQAELDAHRPTNLGPNNTFWVPAYRDVAPLPYLSAVISELMRVTPGVSQTIERIVPDGGFVLPDGRFVPGGTRVGMDPSVICKDAEVFGPEDVMAFVPARWLRREGEGEGEYETRKRRMASTLDFVFSAGKRVCTGRHLAVMETYKFVAALYGAFDIVLKDPAHEWKYRAAWFVFQKDIPVVIRRRNSLQQN